MKFLFQNCSRIHKIEIARIFFMLITKNTVTLLLNTKIEIINVEIPIYTIYKNT